MRVRATATGNEHSNAIGQVELSCTPAGLALGLFGVGAYTEGYAVGALTHGTRFTIPYHNITSARAYGDQLQLQFDFPGLPHERLTLTRFTAGAGVPPDELRRRRLILHLGALAFAALAGLSTVFLSPVLTRTDLAWSTLGYGFCAGAIVLFFGYALDHAFFLRPPGEETTRSAFVRQLSAYVPSLVSTDSTFESPPKKSQLDVSQMLPRSATMVGLALAATILTALVAGERMFMANDARTLAAVDPEPESERPVAAAQPPADVRVEPTQAPSPAHPTVETPPPVSPVKPSDAAHVERRCMCDRADSELWKSPIPRLSALLIERRSVPTKTHLRTHLELSVINNSDTPMNEITVHVQFYESRGKQKTETKERPLYFEGPLQPGHAIKWSTEARGDSYAILVPDFGQLGPNGDGAAPADAFFELLSAHHRPVRLHAARILSYLGDSRAREAALHLKDAMRAAEGPYLRRVLMATGDVRVCDTELSKDTSSQLGVCVYNATEQPISDLGLQLNALSGSLDVQQPLADPPELAASTKWTIPGELPAQSGNFVRVAVPHGLLSQPGSGFEVLADRFDLLD